MRILAYTLIGVTLATVILTAVYVIATFAYVWWADQMYTVGMDINLKAVFVFVFGLVLLCVSALLALRYLRRSARG